MGSLICTHSNIFALCALRFFPICSPRLRIASFDSMDKNLYQLGKTIGLQSAKGLPLKVLMFIQLGSQPEPSYHVPLQKGGRDKADQMTHFIGCMEGCILIMESPTPSESQAPPKYRCTRKSMLVGIDCVPWPESGTQTVNPSQVLSS